MKTARTALVAIRGVVKSRSAGDSGALVNESNCTGPETSDAGDEFDEEAAEALVAR